VAAQDPDRAAVRGPGGEIGFAELEQRSARLAGRLAAAGVGRGDRVGVSLPRTVVLPVVLLGVWRAGAAYVPLDPQHPADRLDHMAADAGIKVLLRSEDLDGMGPEAGTVPDAPAAGPLDPAYVIYTSGSTGRPKGVEITRGAVAALMADLENAGVYAPEPRVVGWNASASFDASVQQWIRLCRGDTVVVLDDQERTDPEQLRAVLDAHGIQDLDLTPSHWELIRECFLDPGRHFPAGKPRLFLGGEAVPERTWRELAEAGAAGRLDAVNLYGPTECTVDATAAWITGEAPHIGRPLPGITAHVVDEKLQPAAEGQAGELCLAGPRLALGYVGRAALTAERFVADPFAAGGGGRLYRTGDLVRRRPDGTLEFLGRADRQVKVRGFRIEPGEIEAVLVAHRAVAAAVVAAARDTAGGTRLIAYHVAAEAGAAAAEEELRELCASRLPEYMVPGVFVPVKAIPLTVNGKVDFEALPEPPTARAPGVDTGEAAGDAGDAGGAPLRGAVEELIADVWCEVLGRDRISADDNFFALGGHSLLALRVISRLKRELGVTVRTREVYGHPRLRDLAEFVETKAAAQ
jgi:amino acid adenylation domain-containing protein